MAEKNGIYKCSICGNVVSVFEAHSGTLVCCGKEMVFQKEKTTDEGAEKHVPVISYKTGKIIVNVGNVPHPMEAGHYIELIQILKGTEVIAEKRLKAGEKPMAEFCVAEKQVKARAFCNVHMLWASK